MKKFLTVLLVIAVMFTFSFGSAFAVTDFDGRTYQAMQAGDYYVGGKVSQGTAGASGITDAERDAYAHADRLACAGRKAAPNAAHRMPAAAGIDASFASE